MNKTYIKVMTFNKQCCFPRSAASIQLTTSIQSHCYCTVYVVIHCCDSVWCFSVEVNLRKLFIVCFIDDAVRDPIVVSERGDIAVTGLNRHICMLAQSQDFVFQCLMSWSFLCSVIWGQRWLFVLLIFVKLLTTTI